MIFPQAYPRCTELTMHLELPRFWCVVLAAVLALAGVAPGAAQEGPLDPVKLPDISGIHLGMKMPEAKAALQKVYPSARIEAMNGGGLGPHNQLAVASFRVQGNNTGHDQAGVDLTMPPNEQLVWHVSRVTPQLHVAHAVLVAGLRQKYGKETFAIANSEKPPANDNEVIQMWWVFNERGQPVTGASLQNGSPFGCNGPYRNTTTGTPYDFYRGLMSKDTAGLSTYCASSYVGVLASIGGLDILDNITLDIVDLAIAVRSAKATDAWSKAEFDKAHQQDAQKSNQVKPSL
jgi:hypothetical protein